MLDQGTRRAILELHRRGHSRRAISKTLRVARSTVREVVRAGTDEVPQLVRTETAEPYRDRILELLKACKALVKDQVEPQVMADTASLLCDMLTGVGLEDERDELYRFYGTAYRGKWRE